MEIGGVMKWFLLVLLFLAGVLGCIALLARPGAEASPDATITVDSAADNEDRDGVITLREAILLAFPARARRMPSSSIRASFRPTAPKPSTCLGRRRLCTRGTTRSTLHRLA
jgi:hypothetical protein